ncbi:hypothetical protein HPG69_002736 [Diceros bicornis minor]|uniref:Uncharacterized protein n=1 Tax=Diceros bicornis minor TaxID=77932 RepID=A0A7J7FLL8_DICBM|nr:hypothetical protein HPG69_002736 [Diceros bicornis minor]
MTHHQQHENFRFLNGKYRISVLRRWKARGTTPVKKSKHDKPSTDESTSTTNKVFGPESINDKPVLKSEICNPGDVGESTTSPPKLTTQKRRCYPKNRISFQKLQQRVHAREPSTDSQPHLAVPEPSIITTVINVCFLTLLENNLRL